MFRKVQNEIIVMMSVVTLIMLGGIYLLKLADQNRISMLMANQQTEKENLLNNVLTMKSNIIKNFVYDYTYWDEMARFVKTVDPVWARENLEASIPSFEVDIVWVYRPDLSLIYCTNTVDENRFRNLPLSSEDLRTILKKGPFSHFYIQIDSELVEVFEASIHPTADEERKTPARGYFFAGRIWSEKYLGGISELSGMNISLEPPDRTGENDIPNDLKKYTLTSIQNLNAWDGKPVAAVKSTTPAVIAKTFKIRSDNQFRMNVLYSILLMAALFLLLFRYINLPLKRLGQSLSTGDARLLQGMLSEKNEFGKLAVMIKESFEHKNQLIEDIETRKEAEEKLMKSEEKYRSIFENIQDVYFEIALDGTIFEITPSIEIFTSGQYRREDLIGQPANQYYLDTKDLDQYVKEMKQSGSIMNRETRVRNRDGSIIICSMSIKFFYDTQGVPQKIIGSMYDITERKTIEEQLLVKNFAVESSVSAIGLADLEGKVIYTNKAFLEMWGYEHTQEFLGKSIGVFAESQNSVEQAFQALRAGEQYVSEEVGRRKDGTLIYVQMSANLVENAEGQPICIMASFIDITDRKKAEEQLLIKNFAVESSVSAIAFTDLQGILFYANQSYLKMWGYHDLNEVAGRHIYEFAEAKDVVDGSVNALKAGVEYISEEMGRRKDGTLFPMQMSANIVRDPEGQPICMMASFIDITDRKKAEEQLIIKDFAVESSVSAIGLADLQGRLFYGNKAYLEMWGFGKPEDMIGQNITDYEFDRENTQKVMKTLRSGKGFVGELWATKRDGTLFYIQMSANLVTSHKGKPVCLMASFLDITERKKAVEVLLESEERYRAMITNSNDLIQSVALDGSFLFVNPSWCHVMGYTEDEVKDLNLFNIIHPDSLSHCRPLFKKVFRGKTVPFIETMFIAKNGKEVFLEGNVAPRIIDGKVIATQSFFHDVTDRKEGEEALSITNQRLNLLQKITESLHESLDPEIIFKRITDAIVKAMGFSTAIVLLIDENREHFHVKSLTSSGTYLTKINQILGYPLYKLVFPVTDRTRNFVFQDNNHNIDVTKHLSEIAHPPLSIATCNAFEKMGGSKNFILIPLIRERVLIGWIVVTSPKEEIPQQDIEMLGTFAMTAVQAIVNADFLEKSNKAREQVQRSLREKEILLRELFHRTKNNMQVISSMLRIRSRTIQDPEVTSIFNDLDSKILSMAMAHQKLYDSEDLSHLDLKEYFQTLVRLFMSTYNIISNHVTFAVTGDNIKVMIDTAIPSGLIVNELISNSLKHAFPDKRKGNIDVNLHVSKKKELIIEVSDNGVGFPIHFSLEKDSNLGLRTTIDLVEYQLQGKIQLIRKNGTLWRITLKEELYSPRI